VSFLWNESPLFQRRLHQDIPRSSRTKQPNTAS
jgi:hypothetical protein